MNHHKGRLFKNNKVTDANIKNFDYLGAKISSGQIWNPTIKDLISFTKKTQELQFVWDAMKSKIVVEGEDVPIRYIRYE